MKRLISIILTAVMVMSLFTAAVVSTSAQTYSAVVKVSGATYIADIGDTFEYSVFFTSTQQVSAAQIEIPYNSAVMTVKTAGGKVDASTTADYNDAYAAVVGNKIVANFASVTPYTFDKRLALKVSFTVKAKGTVDMTPVIREVLNGAGNDIVDISGNKIDAKFSSAVEVTLPPANKYAAKTPLVTLSNVATGVQLKWAKVDGATAYRVFRMNNGSWAKLADTTAVSYIDKTVKSGYDYKYTVRALKGTAFITDYVRNGWNIKYVAQPALPTLTNTDYGISVKWPAVAGAEKYAVFRKNGTKWVQLAATTALSYLDKNVVCGTAYTYTIRCLDGKGTAVSAFNATGATNTYLTAPVVSSVACAVGGVQVKWAKVTGAAKYRVFRRTATTSWKKVADTAAISLLDKTAVSDNTYYYTVRCISADAKSFTSTFNTVGKAVYYIAAPNAPTLTVAAKSVKISWPVVSGAFNYRIFRKVGNGSWAKLADTADHVYEDKTVVSGYKYSYTIRCLNENKTKFISAYNTTGSAVTFIAAPANPGLKNTSTGVKIAWTKVNGAAKYRVFRKTGSGSFVAIGDTTGVTYLDKSAKNGYTYTYTIRCVTADGKKYTSVFNAGSKIVCKR